MTRTRQEVTETTATSHSIFGRVVVGVDGTEPGFEACRQVARLAPPHASIGAVAVVHLAEAAHVGMNAPRIADELERGAQVALDEAVRILGDRSRRRLVHGFVTATLLREIEQANATLAALGSHGHHRLTEILVGGVAGEVLHGAPCSVLISRPSAETGHFPSSIVVGFDGSVSADVALEASEQLAARFAAPLRVVTARGGKGVDLEAVRRRARSTEEADAHPVAALVAVSRTADLLVVGSRGLHGIRALGSVSERVAHQATCSVLVVRSRPSP
jgi:nucleotide-binding universal stress UspA family protein